MIIRRVSISFVLYCFVFVYFHISFVYYTLWYYITIYWKCFSKYAVKWYFGVFEARSSSSISCWLNPKGVGLRSLLQFGRLGYLRFKRVVDSIRAKLFHALRCWYDAYSTLPWKRCLFIEFNNKIFGRKRTHFRDRQERRTTTVIQVGMSPCNSNQTTVWILYYSSQTAAREEVSALNTGNFQLS